MPILSKFPRLQTLSFTKHDFLTSAEIAALKKLTHLHEIKLEIHIPQNEMETIGNFASTISNLTSFKCYRLWRCDTDTHLELQSFANCTNLKTLTLYHFAFSNKAFEAMIVGLLNLETLELSSVSVTSSVVTLIGTYLKQLKTLKIYGGNDDGYSVESLQSLSHHPMMENLAVEQSHDVKTQKTWVADVYKILVTLPKIRRVEMRLKDLGSYSTKKIYPLMDYVEIEVIAYSWALSQ